MKRPHFIIKTLLLVWCLQSVAAFSQIMNLPYSGRLIHENASPIEGPVDLAIEFFDLEDGGTLLSGPHMFPEVHLNSGVFQINLALTGAEFHKIFKSALAEVWIQVSDRTNEVVYGRELMAATPYALKVPVDGLTIGWNQDGELELKENASTTKIDGQKITAKGATAGQVLAWDAGTKSFKPTSIASSTSGIENGGNATGNSVAIGTNDAQPLTIETNNTAAITVAANQDVGIGTTNPTRPLHIRRAGGVTTLLENTAAPSGNQVATIFNAGTSGNLSFGRFSDGGAALTRTDLTIEAASGKVGIGTTNPDFNLTVSAPSNPAFAVTDSATSQSYPAIVAQAFADIGHPIFINRKARGGAGSPSATLAGDKLGEVRFGGHDGTDWFSNTASGITAGAISDFTPTNQESDMKFFTTPFGSAVGKARMTINSAGNVGIGNTAPTSPLSVNPLQYSAGQASQTGLIVTGVGTTWTSALIGSQFVFDNGASGGLIITVDSATSITVSTSQTVSLRNYKIYYPGFNVNSIGNVGIGTISPTVKLEVHDGDIKAKTFVGKRYQPYTTSGHNHGQLSGTTPTDNWLGSAGFVNTTIDPDDPEGYFYIALDTLNDEGNHTSDRHLVVRHNGNVGIKTTTPNEALSVNGGVEILGNAPATPSANTLYSQSLPKAWIHFEGTGPTTSGSFNIGPIVKTGTGRYTLSFLRNMVGGYAVTCSASSTAADVCGSGNHLQGSVNIIVDDVDGVPVDANNINVVVFGNQ